jgi:Ca-activated chloride channel family protein
VAGYGLSAIGLTFAQPFYLWLLVVPGVLFGAGVWRLIRRRAATRRASAARVLPIPERFALAGNLGFWICLIVATGLCTVALARPQASTAMVRKAAADFIMLQDGSASMYAQDVAPSRWQRSVRFLRAFGESLGWRGDRVALALFAHLAAPQVRLTKDPTAFFFFLDHLGDRSPFRLEDDPTWDTNIEEGLRWGLNLVAKDEELFGKSPNVKAFVVISDGQTWSGTVANAIADAQRRQAPVYVVGVGTTAGAMIPRPAIFDPNNPPPVIRAVLDRSSLRDIARAGGGEYFELGAESDRDVASRIIASVKRRAKVAQVVESNQDFYWEFLLAAAVVLCFGTMLLRETTELWWQAAVAIGVLLFIALFVR